MNKDLENLIDLALVDGQLTEKKREVLYKKAKELNVDQDEFELVLEGKLQLVKKALHQTESGQPIQQTQQSNKEGSLKKCPSCGAPAQAFATRCPDCGYEFRNIQATSSVQKLFEMLNELETTRKGNSPSMLGGMGKIFGEALGMKDKIESQKEELISNFPVPNTKEDILEFLTLALPKAKKAGLFEIWGGTERKAHNHLAGIWERKCQQIIMKARFAMKEDKKTLEEIEYLGKKFGIK